MSDDRSSELPRLLRKREVARRLRISRWTLNRLIERDASFPPFTEISPKVHVIAEADLKAWLDRRADAAPHQMHPSAPS